eukprot:1341697-Amorphochlora_amoeboformis.AAC.1
MRCAEGSAPRCCPRSVLWSSGSPINYSIRNPIVFFNAGNPGNFGFIQYFYLFGYRSFRIRNPRHGLRRHRPALKTLSVCDPSLGSHGDLQSEQGPNSSVMGASTAELATMVTGDNFTEVDLRFTSLYSVCNATLDVHSEESKPV